MKKILPYILALVLVSVGSFLPIAAPRVLAQTAQDPLSGIAPPLTPLGAPAAPSFSIPNAPPPDTGAGNPTSGQNTAPANTAPTATPQITKGCIEFSTALVPIPVGINFDACLANVVYIIMWLVSFVLYFAGLVFDVSLALTLHMKEIIAQTKIVGIGWTIFRDLANIFFIFILLWIAISTILGINSSRTKELLAHLILVALFINFSMFITEALIDASNIVSLHFYNLITTVPSSGGSGRDVVVSALTPGNSVSGAFMEGLKIQTLYDPNSAFGGSTAGAGNWGKIIIIGFFGSILMLTAATTFFTGAFLFFARTVVLIFLIMLSPLAFVAFILPGTEKYTEEWWHELMNQCIWAPAYMILIYIVVKIIQAPKGLTTLGGGQTATTWSGAFSNMGVGAAGLIIGFVLVIFMMQAALLIAKKLGGEAAEKAAEWAGSTRGFIGRNFVRTGFGIGGAAGLAAWATRKVAPNSDGAQEIARRLENFSKKADITEIDRRFAKTKFGQSLVGAKVREYTTEALVHAKFGGEKSAFETREEDEVRRAKLEQIERVSVAKNNDARREAAAEENKQFERPGMRDFADKDGVVDMVAFEAAWKNYLEAFRPERGDYDKGPAGDKEYEAAMALYKKTAEEAPIRSKYAGGTGGDQKFAEDIAAYAEKFLEAPDGAAMGLAGVGLARAKKMAADRQKRAEESALRVKTAEEELSSSVNFVSPEGFAEMSEHDIERLCQYANVGQLKAVLKSKEWTVGEKQEMLKPRWEKEVNGFREFQKSADKYKEATLKLDRAFGAKLLEIDKNGNAKEKRRDGSQQIFTRSDGTRFAKTSDGRELDLPAEPKLPSELKNWARNKMTLPEWEIAAAAMPKMFDVVALVQSMRWPMIFQQIRTNENWTYEKRDAMTHMKDAEIDPILDDPKYAARPDHLEEDDVQTRKDALVAAKAAADKAEADARAAGESDAKKLLAARQAAFDETYAENTPKDTVLMRRILAWASGRGAKEMADARGPRRDSKILHKIIDRARGAQWKEKDTGDVTKLLDHLLEDYRAEENGEGVMTSENKELLRYLMEDPRSAGIPRPVSPGLKGLYDKLKAVADGGGRGSIVFPSDEARRGNLG